MPRFGMAVLALAVIAVGSAPAGAEKSAGADRSALVVIGGGLEDPAIYDRILRLAGGPKKARVGILTISSEKARENGRFYERAFRERGAKAAEWIPIDARTRGRAEDAALAAKMRGYNVFFLGGGDQRRYTDVLLKADGTDTKVLAAIRKKFMGSGAVIAGTSAGAAALVDGPMITGGESFDALADPRSVGDRKEGGLRFFRWGLIDTHFAERGRQGRLLRLAAKRSVPLAFGVDENTALVVTKPLGDQPRFRVIGKGGVGVFDLSRAKWRQKGRWSLQNARAHYLTKGDGFNPRSRRPTMASWKRRAPERVRVRTADRRDIFSAVDPDKKKRVEPRAFVRASMAALSPGAQPLNAHPREDRSWRVTLKRTRDAKRYRGASRGRQYRSYKNLRVDIRARPRRSGRR